MDIVVLDQLLDQTPVIVKDLHPVSLAYLRKSTVVYSSLEEIAHLLDSLQPVPLHRALCSELDPRYIPRFPVVTVEHNPFTSELNRVLFDHYDSISTSMLTHAKIVNRIVAEAQNVETIVFVLLDGLSYSDCKDWPNVEPCLATPPTVTRIGFPSIIGEPPLATQLFKIGFTRRVGFTYWDRKDNRLTNRLFYTISNTHRLSASQPDSFREVIDWLHKENLSNTYIQIVRSALDDYAEGHRTVVPRRAIIKQIRQDLEALLGVLQHKGLPALLFAVADHGIMWKDDNHNIEYINLSGARYIRGRSGPGRGRCFEVEGLHYWVLDYPQMGRNWRTNEQGIHGGISFEESIVPFVKWEVNRSC